MCLATLPKVMRLNMVVVQTLYCALPRVARPHWVVILLGRPLSLCLLCGIHALAAADNSGYNTLFSAVKVTMNAICLFLVSIIDYFIDL